MLAKTIKYKDFNGDEREETFLFNLSEAEVMEMELGVSGGMSEMLKRIVETRNGPEIADIFRRIILKSYGEKSLDGKYFKKSEEISEAFRSTNAYNKLFMELLMDEKALEEFMIGIMPVNPKEAREQLAARATSSVADAASVTAVSLG